MLRKPAQAEKERVFSAPLVHAHHCPRGKEGLGETNTEGCRACSALTALQEALGNRIGLVWAPSQATERMSRGDLGKLMNITMKKGKSGIFSDFCSYLLQAKRHNSLLVLSCY